MHPSSLRHVACGEVLRTIASSLLLLPSLTLAEVCNLKVVTDASPDYSDMASLVHSITSKWQTPEQKCWAVFYWNHIARRQTNPISLHGMALTDPIRQFNDYGYTMCSTISGVNQSIWEHMGLKHQYWDISNHTVCQVFYDGRWHMYDSSLTALYTLCDGKTLASIEEIGKEGSCGASGGKVEPGHIAKYHCITSTSPRGFLQGADTIRSLDEEYRCFNPNGLKHRTYFYDWDYGHRYILNLKAGETYTRHYHSLGDTPGYYVPNGGKDPELVNKRYRMRGNGVWTFKPSLTSLAAAYSASNIGASPAGLQPEKPGSPAQVIYKVQSANVTTSQAIEAKFTRRSEQDQVKISVSATNGLHWKDVWTASSTGDVVAKVSLIEEVNGAYETLVRISLQGTSTLNDLAITTTTNLNSKTQPRLNLGKNTIYVGTGDQTDSVVFWPELQGGKYKEMIVEEKNITSAKKHPGYMGTIYPAKAKEDAYVVYRLDAPRDITRVTYGGRFYNRAPRSHIDLLHSFDEGKTWKQSWTLTDTEQPWDVMHYETVQVPAGCRSVLVKFLMNTTEASTSGCSIYAVRMEANHLPVETAFKPLEVTFTWKESQQGRSLAERSHTQLIEKLPFRYTINVSGADHPAVESLAVNLKGARGDLKYGYSDGKDGDASKFTPTWVTYGRNIAVGESYTYSLPSETNWDAGDPDGKKLTDGVVGPPYSGGTSYRSGAMWSPRKNPVITLDLGKPSACASFGMNMHGYPGWDALKGQIQDKIEVLISGDGKAYKAIGFLKTDIRWKDLPANHMWTDEETLAAHTFRLIPEKPVNTRYVQYKVANARHLCVTELEVLDSIRYEPFDLRIALPDEN